MNESTAVAHHTTRANGVRLHYALAEPTAEAAHGGQAAAAPLPPVVLLHGFPATWREWSRLLPILTARGHAVLAPDLRGCGDSEKPAAGYAAANVARDVREILGQLGWDRVLLVGHDIGASVAFSLAAEFPEVVERLVFSESLLPGFGMEEAMDVARGGYWHFGFHRQPDLPERLIAGREREYLDFFFRQFAYNPEAIPAAETDAFLRAYAAPGALRGAFGHYRTLLEDGEVNRDRVRDRGKLRVPVLTVNGVASLDERPVAGLRAAAEEVRSVVLPRCGHWTPLEQPELFAHALAEFFSADGCSGGL